MPHPFRLVDVFGEAAFSGNPLAVVGDAEGLDGHIMQRITRWLNLSETAFLLPPTTTQADYRMRIFTLEREMPFAGHPTLGSCRAWIAAGGVPKDETRIVQECGAGHIPIRRGTAKLAFAAPPLIRSGAIDQAKLDEIANVLRIDATDIVDAQWIDNGPGWVGVLLSSADAVLAIDPARHHPTRLDLGVVGVYAPGGDAAFELRAFFSDHHGGLVEDPVTGSLNASVAQWLLAGGRSATPYVASQGTRLGRTGRIYVDDDRDGNV